MTVVYPKNLGSEKVVLENYWSKKMLGMNFSCCDRCLSSGLVQSSKSDCFQFEVVFIFRPSSYLGRLHMEVVFIFEVVFILEAIFIFEVVFTFEVVFILKLS